MRKILLLIGLLLCVSLVSAQNFTNLDGNNRWVQLPGQGAIIFLGEENLDVRLCLAGAPNNIVHRIDPTTNNEIDQIDITNLQSFTYPMERGTGIWYQSSWVNPLVGDRTQPAFQVQEPHLIVRLWNSDTDTDSGTSIPRESLVRFRYDLDTNLDALTTRPDYIANPAPYIRMGLVTPTGVQLLELDTLDRTTGLVARTPLASQPDPRFTGPSSNWMWPDNRLIPPVDPPGQFGWWAGFRDNTNNELSDFRYPLGRYDLTAVCNVNNMFVNNQVEGQTFDALEFELGTQALSVSTADVTLAKARNKEVTATITGLPGHVYDLFIYDDCPPKMTGRICDRLPFIVGARATLAASNIILDPVNGPYPIGGTAVVDGCWDRMTIREIVPSGDQYPSQGTWDILDEGTRYYARVTTGNDGIARVPLFIDDTIDEGTYKIQVQDSVTNVKAQTDITVTRGDVQIRLFDSFGNEKTADPTFAVGEIIRIEGTNSDTEAVFMWMTGPGIDPSGVNLWDGSSNPIRIPSPDSTQVDGGAVQNYWRLMPDWETDLTRWGPGKYKIWVYSGNADGRFCRCDQPGCENCPIDGCFGMNCEQGVRELENCQYCIAADDIEINLIAPSLMGNVTDVTPCCCPGAECGQIGGTEKFHLTGSAPGNYQNNLNLWIFGPGMVGTRPYLYVNGLRTKLDNSFEYEINREILYPNGIDLCQMAPGTYDLILQTSGLNGVYNLVVQNADTNGNVYIDTDQSGQWEHAFSIDGKGSLFGQEAVRKLLQTFDSSGIDDQYLHLKFTINPKPCDDRIDFNADRNTGSAPLTVNFADNSRISGVSYAWFANNEPIGTGKNLKFVFPEPGKYSIRLEITDGKGDVTQLTKEWYINVLSTPVADFSYDPKSVTVGEPIQFLDQSTGKPTSWLWHFGDGSSSPLQSPVYAYQNPGIYTIMLTVSGENGISAESATQTITVQGSSTPVVADFKTEVTNGTNVQFTDLSSGFGITSWVWDFGDGETSTERNPKHTYLKEGTYQVSLTVSNGSDDNTAKKLIGIR